MNRGEHRLELARTLLHLGPEVDMLATINAMNHAELVHLKGLVDWVEEYEQNEVAEQQPGQQSPTVRLINVPQ